MVKVIASLWTLKILLVYFLACMKVETTTAHKWVPKDPNVERWKLFEYGDQTIPIYLKDDSKKFLKLCISKPGEKEKCPAVEDTVNCIKECSKKNSKGKLKRLEALKQGKIKVEGIQKHINNIPRTGFLWLIWFSCCFMGLFLNIKGHYQWANLPVVGNWLLDSPTDGIKFRHYMWMRWIILGDTNFHWKTYLKADSFIFHWIPLCKLPWDRPPTPAEKRKNEPRDEDHPEWKIQDIVRQKGGHFGDSDSEEGEIEDGWEKHVKKKVNLKARRNKKGRPNLEVEKNKNNLYHDALEEYWIRIYGWAWARYRYRKDAPNILHRKEDASCRNL